MNSKPLRLTGAIVCVLLANVAIAIASDIDEDGIDDAVEQTLINMYRPVLHFDADENVRPSSVEWYVRHSNLVFQGFIQGAPLEIVIIQNDVLNDPNDPESPLRLLFEGSGNFPSSMTIGDPGNPGFRINVSSDFQHGPPAPVEPVGMYAHVVPLSNPLSYSSGPTLPTPPLDHNDFLLLQYWQFFPFNDFQFILDIGNHEGDWMWIDVFVERTCPYSIRYIVYHHHGDSECAPMVLGSGFDPLPASTDAFPLDCAPNNTVPIVDCYLEAGAHEWWPYPGDGGECNFCAPTCVPSVVCCAPDVCCLDNHSHWGQALSLRSENVINLGERFAPMPGVEPQLVMLFNGMWGHDHGVPNGPSGGPLHQEPPGYPFCPLLVAYVDPEAASWPNVGLGSRYHPFTTLSDAIDGLNAVETGGRILIVPQSFPGDHTFTRPMRFERDGHAGTVIFGR